MLNIGDFARFAGVSVRMLRHYDALGLLRPTSVDPFTGYRRYDPALLARADALVALKELGFSLEQVGDLLDQRLSAEQLRKVLSRRRDELREQLEADRARLAEVERRLQLLEGEVMSEVEYVEKPLPAVRLAQLSALVSDNSEVGPAIGPMFERVAATLAPPPPTPAIGWYSEEGDRLRVAAGWEAPAVEGLEQGELPAADRAVTAVYRGPMAGIGDAWQALARHVAEAGLEFAGPCREVYLETPMDAPDDWVTELQQPVR